MTTTELDGKVAVVTGAGQGLGRAEALELARRGARVVVNDVGAALDGTEEASAADAVVSEIREAGGEAVAHKGDVGDFAEGQGLVRTAIETFGDLDILVNNAGILRDRMIFKMSEAEWDAVIRVHLKGHFNTCQAATAYWREVSKEQGGAVYARVINTSSEAFLFGSPGQPNYAAAKAGITALTLAIANGTGRYGVRANAICPRAYTRMTADIFGDDLAEMTPEKVSPLVAYLASPAAEGINGQVFVAYGGFVGLMEAPRLEARFDAPDGTWDVDSLADALGAHFRDRDPDKRFVATDLM